MNWKARDSLPDSMHKRRVNSSQESSWSSSQDFDPLFARGSARPTVRLAYSDEDRTPVIFCIKELDDARSIDNLIAQKR
jgi:hypothetical protein